LPLGVATFLCPGGYMTFRLLSIMGWPVKSKAEIKRQILKLHNEKVDLAYPNMRENYSNLLAAGMKKVGNGSWALAQKKCGIRINYRLPKHKRKIKAHV
jgi:hypothetical protein